MSAARQLADLLKDLNIGKDTTAAAEAVAGSLLSAPMLAAGALVEWGSNANGEYWRWESGLQVCTGTVSLGTVADRARASAVWTFPAAFVPGPTVLGDTVSNDDNAQWVTGGASTSASPTSATMWGGNYRSVFGTTSVAVVILCRCLAIGNWK